MGEANCYLITILYGSELVRCALKIDDPPEYPMEPSAREELHQMLPDHVKSCGPIVNVESLFEVCDRSQG